MRLLPLALVAVVGCSDTGPDGVGFLAVLSGLNEVPPIVVLSGATASFTVTSGQIAYEINVQNITGVTDAGIYLGAAGEVGPKVADLYAGATSGPITAGTLVSGTISASGLTALSLDSLQVLMHNGAAYVNILTTALPSGEVRGQIYQN
jgi:hypothetical protein